MAFARIRSLRARRTTPSSPAVTPAQEDANVAQDANSTITEQQIETIEDEIPIREIAINPQAESIDDIDTTSHYPWNIQTNPICSCGLTNLLCLTDGLCGIIQPPPPPAAATPKNSTSPYFLKVEKVNPNKSGFITPYPPRDRGVCSISKAVSELEEKDAEVVVKEVQLSENEKAPDGKNNTVQSLHLQVGPLVAKETSAQYCVRNNLGQGNECEQQDVDNPEQRIRLPVRAGRNKRHATSANTDDAEPSTFGHRQTNLSTTRSRINRLPVRAGRSNRIRENTTTETSLHEKSSQRRGFAERRRALIAATKKEERTRDEQCIDIPLINISHTISFGNEEIFETITVDHSDKITHCHDELCKSQMWPRRKQYN